MKRAKREAEAEAHAAQRRAEAPTSQTQPAKSSQDVWRRGAVPSIPSRGATAVPVRAESPGPAAAAPTGKYQPGAFGRRAREAAKDPNAGPARTASPVPPVVRNPAPPEPKKNDDGFEPVPEKKVWKPKRLQGQA